jgi:oligopeptide transport system substrate-binding protein
MRARWFFSALALTALALSGCGGHSTRPACPAGQQCLFFGNAAEPSTLDPALSTGSWEQQVIDDLMIGLVQNDAKGDPIPGIAKSWETSPDGLTWTFHLRDAQWSDGLPVTAADFVLGMQREEDPKVASEYASLLYFIKGAEAVNTGKAPLYALGVHALDDHTLRIDLNHPAPYLLQLAKHTAMMPAPRQAVAKWGDSWAQPGHYVSDGPYVLRDWTLNDHITLLKNPRFYDAATVCLDEVVYYPTTDSLSAERRVRRGELDVNTGIKSSRVAFLRRPDQIPAYVHLNTYLGVDYLAFNSRTVPAFRDRRVRQALTMAIDRDFISAKVGRGVSPPADTFVPPGVDNFPGSIKPYWAAWPFARREAEAKRLLAQAGYSPSHPLHVEIKIRGTNGAAFEYAAMQSDWRAIGVDVALARNEAAVAYAAFSANDFQIADAGWLADYNDPMSFLYLLRNDNAGMNYAGYNNPAYDALLNKADAEVDVAKRGVYLAQAEHMMLEDAPVAPWVYAISDALVNPRVTGWADNLLNYHPARYLCFAGARAGR